MGEEGRPGEGLNISVSANGAFLFNVRGKIKE